MPFGISQSQDDCNGWATVKQEADGSFVTVACHQTKQDAVDQMLAISFNEDIEPLGQVDKRDERSSDIDKVASMLDTMTQEARWCSIGNDERRVAYTTIDVREMQEGEGTTLYGYAAVFDSASEPMPFVEYVKRGAFAKTLERGADVRLLIDHEGVPLARTTSGTLRLHEDERGLAVAADLDPNNPDAMRVMSALKRGDLSQMSFAFRTIKDSWSDDMTVRELDEVDLFDVSVVTFPAYERTVAEIRSRQLQQEQSSDNLGHQSIGVNVRRAQLALARLIK